MTSKVATKRKERRDGRVEGKRKKRRRRKKGKGRKKEGLKGVKRCVRE
jgi:hypothetical protein